MAAVKVVSAVIGRAMSGVQPSKPNPSRAVPGICVDRTVPQSTVVRSSSGFSLGVTLVVLRMNTTSNRRTVHVAVMVLSEVMSVVSSQPANAWP
ncbi:MAG: hypothetical protein FWD88_00380, partial [Treponema sp.]|nr:hypothetical protein [Treponema sp.]